MVLLAACTSFPPRTADVPIPVQAGCAYADNGSPDTLVSGSAMLPSGEVRNTGILLSGGMIREVASAEALQARHPAANRMQCSGVLITPGLVNAHEHTAYSFAEAPANMAPVYVHRDEWRFGQNGKPKLDSASTKDQAVMAMIEIRHLLHGETVVAGSGGVPGLVKNISSPASDTNVYAADMQTFPFGPNVYAQFGADPCQVHGHVLSTPVMSVNAAPGVPYVAHVGEGINCVAKSEVDDYLKYAVANPGRKYSLIHALMLDRGHLPGLKSADVAVIWSPRSNLALYGKTLDPAWLLDAGVTVGLGTDWSLSGSYDMLEEMRCARSANRATGERQLSGAEIMRMATSGAARALGIGDKVGTIAPGYQADLVIFDDAKQAGLDGVGSQDNDAMIAVFINGALAAGDSARLQGKLPAVCDNALAGKFLCHEFSKLPFTFAQLLAANQTTLPPMGAAGQAQCGKP